MSWRGGSYGHYGYRRAKRREAEGGLAARSRRGAFVSSWWAERWIAALEEVMDPNRLRRGRTYARKGQVLALTESAGEVLAKVLGSRRTPYEVWITLEDLPDEAWERVLDRLAERALFTAQLLAGEMPREIEEVFRAAGASLFPGSGQEIASDCSCPDWANPCKHVAAVHYLLGERLDDDPFLLFRLRGREHEQVLDALRARRAAAPVGTGAAGGWDEDADEALDDAPEDAAEPLELAMERFWAAPAPLDGVGGEKAADGASARLGPPEPRLPWLARLGEPAFVTGRDLRRALGPPLDAAAAAALRALGGDATGAGTRDDDAG